MLKRKGICKEVIKEQPPARNLSAKVRRVLQGTNVGNQRPLFWSGLKPTNPAISSHLKSTANLGLFSIKYKNPY